MMTHDVPEGLEVCLSHFPVNMNYSNSKKSLRGNYGITGDCVTGVTWKSSWLEGYDKYEAMEEMEDVDE